MYVCSMFSIYLHRYIWKKQSLGGYVYIYIFYFFTRMPGVVLLSSVRMRYMMHTQHCCCTQLCTNPPPQSWQEVFRRQCHLVQHQSHMLHCHATSYPSPEKTRATIACFGQQCTLLHDSCIVCSRLQKPHMEQAFSSTPYTNGSWRCSLEKRFPKDTFGVSRLGL